MRTYKAKIEPREARALWSQGRTLQQIVDVLSPGASRMAALRAIRRAAGKAPLTPTQRNDLRYTIAILQRVQAALEDALQRLQIHMKAFDLNALNAGEKAQLRFDLENIERLAVAFSKCSLPV